MNAADVMTVWGVVLAALLLFGFVVPEFLLKPLIRRDLKRQDEKVMRQIEERARERGVDL